MRRGLGVAAAFLALASCGGGGAAPEATPVAMTLGTLVPDFSLPDVNPASSTYSTDVSPRQFLGAATAWYFGHAT